MENKILRMVACDMACIGGFFIMYLK